MQESIWFAPYTLKARGKLGARAESVERHGILLKIENSIGAGYSDLHPWPELGDEPVVKQITRIATQSALTMQARRSIDMAQLDRRLRSEGVSAFSGLKIPESHFLVNDLSRLNEFADALTAGFKTFKIKITSAVETEIEVLQSISAQLAGCKLRFDFNAIFTSADAARYIQLLNAIFPGSIEFIEDPCQFDQWSSLSTGTSLAFDRPVGNLAEHSKISLEALRVARVGVFIVKPAIETPTEKLHAAATIGARTIVTSYLDHPVGQMHAALEAAKLTSGEVCGLLSHSAYETNAFSEALQTSGPVLTEFDEPGIGFTELLESQDWQKLR